MSQVETHAARTARFGEVRAAFVAFLVIATVTFSVATEAKTRRDAWFEGDTLQLGAGLDVSVHKSVGLLLERACRLDSYHQDDGIVSGPLDDHMDSNDLTIAAQVHAVIGPSPFNRNRRKVSNPPTSN